MESLQKKTWIFRVLTVAGIALMASSFFAPMWWVSLKAPNYPESSFPQGIRIHIHWNGVFNGCTHQGADLDEDDIVDCVYEMDIINHYIGMEPISKGAQLEIKVAPYIFIAFGLLLVVGLFYSGPGWPLLFLPAIILPVAFVADFSAWLWWFGHNLHEWAAFSVKPFMPTVLGEGMVAQFSTYAYPHYGMLLSAAASVCLAFAVLVRRSGVKQKLSLCDATAEGKDAQCSVA